jgi:hypothetical protein
MKKNPKLKIDDRVLVHHLTGIKKGTIIEVTSRGVYKVKLDYGIVLPGVKWFDEKSKKTQFWYLIEKVEENEEGK